MFPGAWLLNQTTDLYIDWDSRSITITQVTSVPRAKSPPLHPPARGLSSGLQLKLNIPAPTTASQLGRPGSFPFSSVSLLGSPCLCSQPRDTFPLLFLPCVLRSPPPPQRQQLPLLPAEWSREEKAAAFLFSKLELGVDFRGETALHPVTGFLIVVNTAVSLHYGDMAPGACLGTRGNQKELRKSGLNPDTGFPANFWKDTNF